MFNTPIFAFMSDSEAGAGAKGTSKTSAQFATKLGAEGIGADALLAQGAE